MAEWSAGWVPQQYAGGGGDGVRAARHSATEMRQTPAAQREFSDQRTVTNSSAYTLPGGVEGAMRRGAPHYTMSACVQPYDGANLGGVIFHCNVSTYAENIERMVFGMAERRIELVSRITTGMPLFLYNTTTKEMHSGFIAASAGGLLLEPFGWRPLPVRKKKSKRGKKAAVAQQQQVVAEKHERPMSWPVQPLDRSAPQFAFSAEASGLAPFPAQVRVHTTGIFAPLAYDRIPPGALTSTTKNTSKISLAGGSHRTAGKYEHFEQALSPSQVRLLNEVFLVSANPQLATFRSSSIEWRPATTPLQDLARRGSGSSTRSNGSSGSDRRPSSWPVNPMRSAPALAEQPSSASAGAGGADTARRGCVKSPDVLSTVTFTFVRIRLTPHLNRYCKHNMSCTPLLISTLCLQGAGRGTRGCSTTFCPTSILRRPGAEAMLRCCARSTRVEEARSVKAAQRTPHTHRTPRGAVGTVRTPATRAIAATKKGGAISPRPASSIVWRQCSRSRSRRVAARGRRRWTRKVGLFNLLLPLTFRANPAHNLTRSPEHLLTLLLSSPKYTMGNVNQNKGMLEYLKSEIEEVEEELKRPVTEATNEALILELGDTLFDSALPLPWSDGGLCASDRAPDSTPFLAVFISPPNRSPIPSFSLLSLSLSLGALTRSADVD